MHKGFQSVLKMHSTGAITTRLCLGRVKKRYNKMHNAPCCTIWYNRDTEHHRQHSYIHSPEERKRKEGMVWGPGRRCAHYIYSGYSPATDDAMQCEQKWFYDDDQLLHTHTFDNHTHRVGVPRLERSFNRGELAWPHEVSSVGPPPPPRGVYDDAESLKGLRRNEGMSTAKLYGSLH